MKNSKKVSLGALIILSLSLTAFTWSYWNSAKIIPATQAMEGNTVVLGAAKNQSITTSLTGQFKGSQKALVPAAFADNTTTTGQAVNTFSVAWSEKDSKTATGALGKLSASISDVKIIKSGTKNSTVSQEALDLVKYTIDVSTDNLVLNQNSVNTTVTFTLDEPQSKAVYDEIVNSTIEYTITFTVNPEA